MPWTPPDGHLVVARANAACGIASIVPELGTFSYEEVAAAAPAAARIAQLHPYESSTTWRSEREARVTTHSASPSTAR